MQHSHDIVILPMSSLRPMLSKSMTITSNAASLSCSTGNVYSNFSSNIGFRLHLNTVLLRFSTFLSPTCSQTFTYGSEGEKKRSALVVICIYYCCPVVAHIWEKYSKIIRKLSHDALIRDEIKRNGQNVHWRWRALITRARMLMNFAFFQNVLDKRFSS